MSTIIQPEPRRALRSAASVRELPSVVFGSRNMVWWGTVGFMVIEGYSLLIVAAVYFYLRQNYHAWPPYRIAQPSLTIPTVQLVVMLLSLVPAWLLDHAARRFDRAAVRRWLLVCIVFAIAMCALRWFEFGALNTRWDTTAYGSVQWFLVGFHGTLILLEAAEVIGFALILMLGTAPASYMSDASDVGLYWYFMVLVWVPLYFLIYVLPHLTR